MISEEDGLSILEEYLEDYSDISEIASNHLTTPHRVRECLMDRGIEAESIEDAVEERIDLALRKSMSRKEAARFVRPDNGMAHNERKYDDRLALAGLIDRDDLVEETESYLVESEVDPLNAAYWFLKENSIGVRADDLAYFFSEGLNYSESTEKPSGVDEVIGFLENSQIENDPWYKVRDEFLIPSHSVSAERRLSEVEEHTLEKVFYKMIEK